MQYEFLTYIEESMWQNSQGYIVYSGKVPVHEEQRNICQSYIVVKHMS